MQLVSYLCQQPKWLVILEASILLAMVGVLDYVTGRALSVSLLYAMIVLMIAWCVNARLALIFAILSGFIWWLANMDVHPFGGNWGYAWATLSRMATFLFVAKAGAAVKAKQESDQQRIDALERAKALEQDIARISEHEQRRIGQDLHDGICQELAAIRCAVSSLRDDLQEKNAPEAETTGEVAQMIGNAIIEVRNLARGIFPVQMEAAGLPAVLDELVESTRRLHRTAVTFEMIGDVKIADPEVAMHLYRIAQEALSNAIKHGQATRISVCIRINEQALKLTVTDNGQGFESSLVGNESMGLRTMRYRAGLIGAAFSVNSGLDGVTVTCELPLASIPLRTPPA